MFFFFMAGVGRDRYLLSAHTFVFKDFKLFVPKGYVRGT